ncbi:MAG: hypothetical protein HDS65_03375 [Bacteroidales bacterium]|nr:hypothetical protein [Bacteroidales bacterium]
MSRRSFFVALLCLALPALMAWAVSQSSRPVHIGPTIPTADRNTGRVFLERADILKKNPQDSFMILTGDVVFTKGPMIMRCDSAHYFADSESLDAFGNVSMEQGDTLFVYADELNYDGASEIATLYADPGKKVRLINRDVTLSTDIFIYDLGIDLGYYEVGGTLSDPSNTLSSIYGEYNPTTKEANFYTQVHLNSRNTSDTLDIYSDTLYYNTISHIAELHSPSTVVNARGTIYTRLGVYDTDSNRTTLFDRSLIVTDQGQRLIADTIFYDRAQGFGEAFGNMILTDSAHNVEVRGNYGFYNELTDSSFVTGRAMIVEYSKEDTLWLHGRYIQSFLAFDSTLVEADTIAGTPEYTRVDTSHVAVVYPRVRFFRRDMQGVCDSLRYTEADTTIRMYVNPVIWNEEQQIFGNIIEVELNDSTIDRARLPEQAFTAQHLEGPHYNQMSGKEMIAWFEGGEMRRLDINGNVEIIMYPEENDSTINKMVNAESSFLTATFKGRTTEFIKLWPQTSGQATPLFLAKRSNYYLPKFQWYEDMRPLSPEDIFTVPPMQEELMSTAERPAAGAGIDLSPVRRGMIHARPDADENLTPAPPDTTLP